MRWGIRKEAGDNHETSKICMDELKRCREDSPAVDYVLILADKWAPLAQFPVYLVSVSVGSPECFVTLGMATGPFHAL